MTGSLPFIQTLPAFHSTSIQDLTCLLPLIQILSSFHLTSIQDLTGLLPFIQTLSSFQSTSSVLSGCVWEEHPVVAGSYHLTAPLPSVAFWQEQSPGHHPPPDTRQVSAPVVLGRGLVTLSPGNIYQTFKQTLFLVLRSPVFYTLCSMFCGHDLTLFTPDLAPAPSDTLTRRGSPTSRPTNVIPSGCSMMWRGPPWLPMLSNLGVIYVILGVIYVFLQVGACPPHSSYC